MIIYPAIDLRNGRRVILRQEDPEKETIFWDNPVELAARWVQQGAEWLHIVNLDGAFGDAQAHLAVLHRPSTILIQHPGSSQAETPNDELMRGLPLNLRRLREICSNVDIPVQFGGGLRTLDDIRLAIELGAARVVLDAVAVEMPKLICDAINLWGPERVVANIDASCGKIATQQRWKKVSSLDAIELGHRIHALGVRRVIYTHINRDGMLNGPSIEAAARLGDMTGLKVIVRGGVAHLCDVGHIKAHEHYNIDGVIIGQAIYAGSLDLRQAIELGHQPLRRRSAGIIPFRYGKNGPEFLLLFNLFFDQWQFPRGGVQSGESDRNCSLRKFREETGLSVTQLHEDCRVELNYVASIRNYSIERTVVYYLGEVEDGEIRLGHENHCEARWQSAEETWELLTETAPEQLPALDAALAYLQAPE